MLNPERPGKFPTVEDTKVIRISSPTVSSELGYFANVIHRVDTLKRFQFQRFRVSHNALGEESSIRDTIPLEPFCPLNFVTIGSFFMTIGLFIFAGIEHDAVAILGLGTMSLSTSMACLSAQWRVKIPKTHGFEKDIKGDVMICTPNRAWVLVHCSQEIMRELYAAREGREFVYKGHLRNFLLSGSTVLLMAAIIFLSNCTWKLQIAIGLAYIILNLVYWGLALLTNPLSMWKPQARYIIEFHDDHVNSNYTELLWDVIRSTGEIEWIRQGELAPATKNWDGWLEEAKLNHKNDDWDPETARNRWMAKKL